MHADLAGLNDVARSIRTTEFLRSAGALSGAVSVQYPEVIRNLEKIQGRLSEILERETLDAGVKIEYGVTAEVDGNIVYVNGVPRVAEAVVIACGAEINVPDVAGADLSGAYTARTIRSLPALPRRMVIVGGGISAAEFAYIFSAFGVEVTLIARSTLLPVLPERMQKAVRRDLSRVTLLENTPLDLVLGFDAVAGVVAGGTTIPCDAVLFATGMRPKSPHVRGVAKRPDGSIIVNDQMETSVAGVYACGDVLGAPYFTPVSRLQGFVAADAILGRPRTVDLSVIPFTVVLGLDYTVCPSGEASGQVFSSPNIAGPESVWHVSDGSVSTMELTVDPSDGKILGFASSGPGTGIVGTHLGYLVRKGVTVHEFSPMLEVHPNPDGLYALIRFAGDHPTRP